MESIFSIVESAFNDSDNVYTSFKIFTGYSGLLFLFASPFAIIMTVD